MPERFRFSPRPNMADRVHWRPWSADAFREAATADRPVLLNLTAAWCQWCNRMDETTYSDAGLIDLINGSLVPIRVDADRYPHVQDRYIAGGWPTNAFLTPTGEVLWAGGYVDREEFARVAAGVLQAWDERRDELRVEIERRRRALEAARAHHVTAGLVRREAADDVLAALQESFDPRNGGFGTAPKFPDGDAIELLFSQGHRTGNADWLAMAERTLDGILAGDLWDAVDGGFFRYASGADWTEPHLEKMLPTQAALLRAFSLGAHLAGRGEWRHHAEGTVAWVDRSLRLPGGLWGGSRAADAEYYAPGEDRAGRPDPALDPTIFTSWNAAWIAALADAGGRLGRADWVATAAAALPELLRRMAAPDDLLHHYLPADGEPALPGLLTDLIETGCACLAVFQATGDDDALDHARRLAAGMERHLWAEDGGFWDHLRPADRADALRYRERPFHQNAAAARFLHDLSLATGQRTYRALAEFVLALLSPRAGRYGVEGAVFARGVEDFFDPPLRIVIVGPPDAAAELRAAALALPDADRRVWSFAGGGRIGQQDFPAADVPVAYVCGVRACSPPLRDVPRLLEAVDAHR
jgi:uncharacterized protein